MEFRNIKQKLEYINLHLGNMIQYLTRELDQYKIIQPQFIELAKLWMIQTQPEMQNILTPSSPPRPYKDKVSG